MGITRDVRSRASSHSYHPQGTAPSSNPPLHCPLHRPRIDDTPSPLSMQPRVGGAVDDSFHSHEDKGCVSGFD
jgi:hypothetical protein